MVLLSTGNAGCQQDECNGVIALCASEIYVAVDVPGATVTPVVGEPTPPDLGCRSNDTSTTCDYFTAPRVQAATYLYDVAWAGHTQRVSLIVTDVSRPCCHSSTGHAIVSFRGDAGP